MFQYIEEQLLSNGLAVCQPFDLQLPLTPLAELSQQLRTRVMNLDEQKLQLAGTGREQAHQLNRQIRRDRIRWLTQENPAEKAWLDFMAQLQQHLNRTLLLGLFSYECHFSHYRPGDFYQKHKDAFIGQSNRVLSTVLYLNPDWQADEGGELLIYGDEENDAVRSRLLPQFGTLVTFLSEEFPHEVLAANRHRYSIAGWFRLNSSVSHRVDPPR
ncbi:MULTISPECIES: 2OG-Fe(II) oxygenase [unclassified Oceanobacter]|uniref:2OG-Fe(II) oxygenase n=1 Tax=unclassified Oceanobacter TaxID=2620260 RepID=UPI002732D44A|nr:MULTISPECIES: 2OG-Fe(II) oxygenase [unclassified Oceanobacter]MDP2609431.1 2OG-Fe(II) oxygenase [Oceanobacter sp. 1_MG-2023]MDP2612869.1 2OG-Fe(II) oxygenase [Oceanobacter sp. 2_MG-2023]